MANSTAKKGVPKASTQLSFAFEAVPLIPAAPLDCDDWLLCLADFPRLHADSSRSADDSDTLDSVEASWQENMTCALPPALRALSLSLD